MAGESQQTIVQPCAICGARFQVYAAVREAVCPACGATNQIGVRAAPARMPAPRRPMPAARPVVVIKESSAQSWMVLVMLLIIGGLGYGVYQMRDRLWPKAERMPTAPGRLGAPADVEEQYREARARLLDGDRDGAREAARTFRMLDTPGLAQPQRNWVTFHAGLAHLLAGETEPAADRFQRLGERAAFSTTEADARLVAFFTQCAQLGGSDAPVPVEAGEKLDRTNFESIGLLLFALKNVALGQPAEAGAFFGEFAKATPAGADAWIAEYKPIAEEFTADFAQWRTASDAATAAKAAPEKLAAALTTTQEAARNLKSKRFAGDLAKLEADLTARVAAHEAEKSKMNTEQERADAAQFEELRKKTEALALEFRFTEAQAAAAAAQFASERRKEDWKLVQKRMDSLVRFKRNLAADFATLGFRGGVLKRDGKPAPGAEVRKADDAQIETVPWADVSPDWLTKVAGVYADATARLDYKSDRQFDLGVFLLLLGKKAEADAWMMKAGDIKYEYKDAAMLIFDPPP